MKAVARTSACVPCSCVQKSIQVRGSCAIFQGPPSNHSVEVPRISPLRLHKLNSLSGGAKVERGQGGGGKRDRRREFNVHGTQIYVLRVCFDPIRHSAAPFAPIFTCLTAGSCNGRLHRERNKSRRRARGGGGGGLVCFLGEPYGRQSGPVRVGPGPSPSQLRRRQTERNGHTDSPLEAASGARPISRFQVMG